MVEVSKKINEILKEANMALVPTLGMELRELPKAEDKIEDKKEEAK